jgi:hypothetical protein
MGSSPIVWELALVVVAVAGFAVWQLWSLKRDGEALRRQREAEEARSRRAAAEASDTQARSHRDLPPP